MSLYIFLSWKFIYSEKAVKFCEIFFLLLTTVHRVKSMVKIFQNFVAFSEYVNFMQLRHRRVKSFSILPATFILCMQYLCLCTNASSFKRRWKEAKIIIHFFFIQKFNSNPNRPRFSRLTLDSRATRTFGVSIVWHKTTKLLMVTWAAF